MSLSGGYRSGLGSSIAKLLREDDGLDEDDELLTRPPAAMRGRGRIGQGAHATASKGRLLHSSASTPTLGRGASSRQSPTNKQLQQGRRGRTGLFGSKRRSGEHKTSDVDGMGGGRDNTSTVADPAAAEFDPTADPSSTAATNASDPSASSSSLLLSRLDALVDPSSFFPTDQTRPFTRVRLVPVLGEDSAQMDWTTIRTRAQDIALRRKQQLQHALDEQHQDETAASGSTHHTSSSSAGHHHHGHGHHHHHHHFVTPTGQVLTPAQHRAYIRRQKKFERRKLRVFQKEQRRKQRAELQAKSTLLLDEEPESSSASQEHSSSESDESTSEEEEVVTRPTTGGGEGRRPGTASSSTSTRTTSPTKPHRALDTIPPADAEEKLLKLKRAEWRKQRELISKSLARLERNMSLGSDTSQSIGGGGGEGEEEGAKAKNETKDKDRGDASQQQGTSATHEEKEVDSQWKGRSTSADKRKGASTMMDRSASTSSLRASPSSHSSSSTSLNIHRPNKTAMGTMRSSPTSGLASHTRSALSLHDAGFSMYASSSSPSSKPLSHAESSPALLPVLEIGGHLVRAPSPKRKKAAPATTQDSNETTKPGPAASPTQKPKPTPAPARASSSVTSSPSSRPSTASSTATSGGGGLHIILDASAIDKNTGRDTREASPIDREESAEQDLKEYLAISVSVAGASRSKPRRPRKGSRLSPAREAAIAGSEWPGDAGMTTDAQHESPQQQGVEVESEQQQSTHSAIGSVAPSAGSAATAAPTSSSSTPSLHLLPLDGLPPPLPVVRSSRKGGTQSPLSLPTIAGSPSTSARGGGGGGTTSKSHSRRSSLNMRPSSTSSSIASRRGSNTGSLSLSAQPPPQQQLQQQSQSDKQQLLTKLENGADDDDDDDGRYGNKINPEQQDRQRLAEEALLADDPFAYLKTHGGVLGGGQGGGVTTMLALSQQSPGQLPITPRLAYSRLRADKSELASKIIMSFSHKDLQKISDEIVRNGGEMDQSDFIRITRRRPQGDPNFHAESEALAEMFQEIDVNGDGTLSFLEFTSYLVDLAHQQYASSSTPTDRPTAHSYAPLDGADEALFCNEDDLEYSRIKWIEGLESYVAFEGNQVRFKILNRNLQTTKIIRGHTAQLLDVEYLPGHHMLVTSSMDRTLKFWSCNWDRDGKAAARREAEKQTSSSLLASAGLDSAGQRAHLLATATRAGLPQSSLDLLRSKPAGSGGVVAGGGSASADLGHMSMPGYHMSPAAMKSTILHSTVTGRVVGGSGVGVGSGGSAAAGNKQPGLRSLLGGGLGGSSPRKAPSVPTYAEICSWATPLPQHHLVWNKTRLYSSDSTGRILVWNVDTGDTRANLLGHEGMVHALIPITVYDMLASGAEDTTVRLWDNQHGSEVARFEKHERPIRALSYSPTQGLLASAGDDDYLRLYDVNSSKHVGSFFFESSWFQTLPGVDADRVVSMDCLEHALVVGSARGIFRVYDLRKMQVLQTFRLPEIGEEDGGVSMATSGSSGAGGGSEDDRPRKKKLLSMGGGGPNNNNNPSDPMAAADEDLDLEAIRIKRRMKVPLFLNSFCVFRDEKLLAAHQKKVLEAMREREEEYRRAVEVAKVMGAPLPLPDTSKVDLPKDPRCQMIVAANGRYLHRFGHGGNASHHLSHDDPVLFAEFNPVSMTILSVSAKQVKIWDMVTGRLLREHNDILSEEDGSGVGGGGHHGGGRRVVGPPLTITSACLDQRKRKFIVGDSGGNIYIYNFNTGSLMHKLSNVAAAASLTAALSSTRSGSSATATASKNKDGGNTKNGHPHSNHRANTDVLNLHCLVHEEVLPGDDEPTISIHFAHSVANTVHIHVDDPDHLSTDAGGGGGGGGAQGNALSGASGGSTSKRGGGDSSGGGGGGGGGVPDSTKPAPSKSILHSLCAHKADVTCMVQSDLFFLMASGSADGSVVMYPWQLAGSALQRIIPAADLLSLAQQGERVNITQPPSATTTTTNNKESTVEDSGLPSLSVLRTPILSLLFLHPYKILVCSDSLGHIFFYYFTRDQHRLIGMIRNCKRLERLAPDGSAAAGSGDNGLLGLDGDMDDEDDDSSAVSTGRIVEILTSRSDSASSRSKSGGGQTKKKLLKTEVEQRAIAEASRRARKRRSVVGGLISQAKGRTTRRTAGEELPSAASAGTNTNAAGVGVGANANPSNAAPNAGNMDYPPVLSMIFDVDTGILYTSDDMGDIKGWQLEQVLLAPHRKAFQERRWVDSASEAAAAAAASRAASASVSNNGEGGSGSGSGIGAESHRRQRSRLAGRDEHQLLEQDEIRQIFHSNKHLSPSLLPTSSNHDKVQQQQQRSSKDNNGKRATTKRAKNGPSQQQQQTADKSTTDDSSSIVFSLDISGLSTITPDDEIVPHASEWTFPLRAHLEIPAHNGACNGIQLIDEDAGIAKFLQGKDEKDGQEEEEQKDKDKEKEKETKSNKNKSPKSNATAKQVANTNSMSGSTSHLVPPGASRLQSRQPSFSQAPTGQSTSTPGLLSIPAAAAAAATATSQIQSRATSARGIGGGEGGSAGSASNRGVDPCQSPEMEEEEEDRIERWKYQQWDEDTEDDEEDDDEDEYEMDDIVPALDGGETDDDLADYSLDGMPSYAATPYDTHRSSRAPTRPTTSRRSSRAGSAKTRRNRPSSAASNASASASATSRATTAEQKLNITIEMDDPMAIFGSKKGGDDDDEHEGSGDRSRNGSARRRGKGKDAANATASIPPPSGACILSYGSDGCVHLFSLHPSSAGRKLGTLSQGHTLASSADATPNSWRYFYPILARERHDADKLERVENQVEERARQVAEERAERMAAAEAAAAAAAAATASTHRSTTRSAKSTRRSKLTFREWAIDEKERMEQEHQHPSRRSSALPFCPEANAQVSVSKIDATFSDLIVPISAPSSPTASSARSSSRGRLSWNNTMNAVTLVGAGGVEIPSAVAVAASAAEHVESKEQEQPRPQSQPHASKVDGSSKISDRPDTAASAKGSQRSHQPQLHVHTEMDEEQRMFEAKEMRRAILAKQQLILNSKAKSALTPSIYQSAAANATAAAATAAVAFSVGTSSGRSLLPSASMPTLRSVSGTSPTRTQDDPSAPAAMRFTRFDEEATWTDFDGTIRRKDDPFDYGFDVEEFLADRAWRKWERENQQQQNTMKMMRHASSSPSASSSVTPSVAHSRRSSGDGLAVVGFRSPTSSSSPGHDLLAPMFPMLPGPAAGHGSRARALSQSTNQSYDPSHSGSSTPHHPHPHPVMSAPSLSQSNEGDEEMLDAQRRALEQQRRAAALEARRARAAQAKMDGQLERALERERQLKAQLQVENKKLSPRSANELRMRLLISRRPERVMNHVLESVGMSLREDPRPKRELDAFGQMQQVQLHPSQTRSRTRTGMSGGSGSKYPRK